MFKSQYTGTHRLNLTFNVPVAASSVYPGDLAECYDSDNTGFQKFFQGSNVNSFTKVDQDIYFVNYDGINGRELWKTDGTTSGTKMVKDIYNGPSGSDPQTSRL